MTGRRGDLGGKGLHDTEPSRQEKAAQRWHDDANHTRYGNDCWCCCTACAGSNPHIRAARQAALADIETRLRDALKPARSLPAKRSELDCPDR